MTWPRAVSAAGVSCGIKPQGALDLGLLVAEQGGEWAGAFTTNAAAAPAVQWSRARRGRRVRALVVNSGNANACTGRIGSDAVQRTASAVADALGCERDEVLVASTGPIGVRLPVDRVVSGIDRAALSLSPDVGPFARAILTTDTSTKIATQEVGAATIVGVAKGAAMVAPNMATMLAFVATDARVDPGHLQRSLARAVDQSFNRLCIDACESTNDCVFCISSGCIDVDPAAFERALEAACVALAHKIVRDAEGATKVVRIAVTNAPDEPAALACARAVAASSLWRAAIHGADPNWGRVLAALGSARRDLNVARVSIRIGDEGVFERGEPCGDLAAVAKAMTGDFFEVGCDLGAGAAAAWVLTSDLSADYVRLNAYSTT